jgi:hypothetical protein
MKLVLAHGFLGIFDFFPMLFIGAAIWIIVSVVRDGQSRALSKTPKLPTNSWSRQVAAATRKRGPAKPATPAAERPGQPRRVGPPHLRVLEGKAPRGPVVPRRFEPPTPGRKIG